MQLTTYASVRYDFPGQGQFEFSAARMTASVAGYMVMLRGDPGPQGPVGQPTTFVQANPATVWTVNHNLGRLPQVTILSSGGAEISAEVTHPSVNTTIVTFNAAQAGSAIIV